MTIYAHLLSIWKWDWNSGEIPLGDGSDVYDLPRFLNYCISVGDAGSIQAVRRALEGQEWN